MNMEGWTEEEIKNKELRAPCGIFCGACAIYIATRDDNEKFRSIISGTWKTKPEETKCYGCMQSDPPKQLFGFCRQCTIRSCVKSKGFYSCHQCAMWPCDKAENIELANVIPAQVRNSVLRVMKRSIPLWRAKVAEHGNEKGSLEWAQAECERYHCPSCGKPLYRSAQHCRVCKTSVADELDGII
jgi:hypothetical protein